jgi:hypothetical protein
MTFSRPADDVVDHLVAQSPLTGMLPAGWRQVEVSGVERTIVIGPGGIFVILTRAASVIPSDGSRHQPWNGDERRQRGSAARLISELVSQLLSGLCDLDLTCTPIIVLDDDDTRLVARFDDVAVLHRRRLAAWLDQRPTALSTTTIDRVLQAAQSTRNLHSV